MKKFDSGTKAFFDNYNFNEGFGAGGLVFFTCCLTAILLRVTLPRKIKLLFTYGKLVFSCP
jgi:hypothetical protein